MTLEEAEVSLQRFVESTWFKAIARGAMILSAIACTAITGFVGWELMRMNAAETAISKLDQAVDKRVEISDSREAINYAFRLELRSAIGLIQSDQSLMRENIAKITGILEEMQRRDRADLARLTRP